MVLLPTVDDATLGLRIAVIGICSSITGEDKALSKIGGRSFTYFSASGISVVGDLSPILVDWGSDCWGISLLLLLDAVVGDPGCDIVDSLRSNLP